MATHQSTQYSVEISVPKGIHLIEQIWHANTSTSTGTLPTVDQHPSLGTNCCTGVVFQTIKSFVHALGIYLQMIETTIN